MPSKAFVADKAPPPGLANSVYRNDGQPEPIPGSPAAGLGAAGRGLGERQGEERAVAGARPLDRRRGRSWEARRPTPASPRSTSTATATSTWCSRPTARRPSPSSTTGWAISTSRARRTSAILESRLGAARHRSRPGRPADLVAPSPRRPSRRPCGTRPSGRPPTRPRSRSSRSPTNAERWRSAIAADLDLDGPPDLLGLPARRGKPGEARLAGLGTQRRASGSRPASCPSAWRRPALDGPGAGRPGRRPAARPPARPPGRAPGRWPATWATATTGWRFSSAATGGSSPS